MNQKKIVIIGGKESGTGAAVLAKKQGYDVFVSDQNQIPGQYKNILLNHNIEWEEGTHTGNKILDALEIIKSPGIPNEAPVIKAILSKKIPVISEIEFASRYTNAQTICVTGSNGKTTTTNLIYHIFLNAGMNVGLAGNIGKSFAMQVAENDFDIYIVELSSFQLEDIDTFKPNVAVILNITPDHLDRYHYDMQEYVNSKFIITKNLTASDTFIYSNDDPYIIEKIKSSDIQAELLSFSIEQTEHQTAYIQNEQIIITYLNKQFTMDIKELSLSGKHNIYNSMAAGIAARIYDIRKETIRESLSGFQGVEHRLEPYLKIRDVQFINDSKATNINSTWYALESMSDNVIWIAGGIDKGNDYSVLKDLVKDKVKAIVCLGKDNTKIHKAFDSLMPQVVDTGSMDEAVSKAFLLADKGDTVLLSPACASFDLFDNYEDRGNQFKDCVRKL